MSESVAGPTLSISLEFGGGMELLFGNTHNHSVSIPAYYQPSAILPDLPPPKTSQAAPTPGAEETGVRKADVRFLIWWMRWWLLDDLNRPELFSQGDTIRPGILILINDADWELEGELDYEIKAGDNLVFISTLHGG